MRKSSFAECLGSRVSKYSAYEEAAVSQLQPRDIIVESLRAELRNTQQYCKHLSEANGQLRDELEAVGDRARLEREKADFEKCMALLKDRMGSMMEELESSAGACRDNARNHQEQLEQKNEEIAALKAQVALLTDELRSSQSLLQSELTPLRHQLQQLKESSCSSTQPSFYSPSKHVFSGYQSMLTPSYSPRTNRYETASKYASELSALQLKVEELQKRSGVGVLADLSNTKSDSSNLSRNYSPREAKNKSNGAK